MVFNASRIAFSSVSIVRAFALRKNDFSFDHSNSIGLNSGLYGGKKSMLAPLAFIGSRTPFTL